MGNHLISRAVAAIPSTTGNICIFDVLEGITAALDQSVFQVQT